MSLDTKPNLDKSKFEQLEGDILNLSGCTNIYGCLDVKKSGVINSNNGFGVRFSFLSFRTFSSKPNYLDREQINELSTIDSLIGIVFKSYQEKVKWDKRKTFNKEGYSLIGLRLGLEKDEDGKNIQETMVEFDACERIGSTLKDDMSVFIKGKIEFSSFDGQDGKKRSIKFIEQKYQPRRLIGRLEGKTAALHLLKLLWPFERIRPAIKWDSRGLSVTSLSASMRSSNSGKINFS